MARLFATGFLVSIFAACGGQTDVGGPAGSLSLGGSAPSAGGYTSVSTGATGGSTPASTGGSTSASNGGSAAIDPNTICNGMFAGHICDVLAQLTNVKSCDIPLQLSPMFSLVQVTFDCAIITRVPPDAGMAGYYIDYSYSPAHLELTGDTCSNMLRYGAQSVVVLEVAPGQDC